MRIAIGVACQPRKASILAAGSHGTRRSISSAAIGTAPEEELRESRRSRVPRIGVREYGSPGRGSKGRLD